MISDGECLPVASGAGQAVIVDRHSCWISVVESLVQVCFSALQRTAGR